MVTRAKTTLWARQAAVAMGAAAMVASCTPQVEASTNPVPEIVWEVGPPSGGTFDTEWAPLYLEAVKQLSLAQAYGDFSDPALIAAVGYDAALAEAEIAAKYRFSTPAAEIQMYGPAGTWAFYGTIVSIAEDADSASALVRTCHAETDTGTTVLRPDQWLISKSPDGGVTAEHQGSGGVEDCQDAEPWIGAWATPIDVTDVGRDEVKMPLPREYYIDLGVISE